MMASSPSCQVPDFDYDFAELERQFSGIETVLQVRCARGPPSVPADSLCCGRASFPGGQQSTVVRATLSLALRMRGGRPVSRAVRRCCAPCAR